MGGGGYEEVTPVWTIVNTAAIDFYANQDYTDVAQGSYITMSTTDDDSSTLDERVRIDHNGNVGIGTATPDTKLHVVQGTPFEYLPRD